MIYLVKVAVFLFLFIWIRATLPRIRYDRLMRFGWQLLLPLAVLNAVITATVVALGWPWWVSGLAGLAIIVAVLLYERRKIGEGQKEVEGERDWGSEDDGDTNVGEIGEVRESGNMNNICQITKKYSIVLRNFHLKTRLAY